MAQEVGIEMKTTITRSDGNNLSSEAKALVHEFYGSNDISLQAPGRKDFIIICTVDQDGEKSQKIKQ